VSADRPGAYRYSRRAFPGKRIDEARFAGSQTLRDVYDHVKQNQAGDWQTVSQMIQEMLESVSTDSDP
jgi:hypothetical protein